MKHLYGFLILLPLLFVLLSCEREKVGSFTELQGEKLQLKVNRVSDHPELLHPSDPLSEENFVAVTDTLAYEVDFSQDLQRVTIQRKVDDLMVTGTLTIETEESLQYDLSQGLFAGGRLMIWSSGKTSFDAEYTVYGSGIPIIKSVRGMLQ